MSDSVKDFVNGLGAIAESCGILRDALISSGFTRTEAIALCRTYLQSLVTQSKNSSSES